MKVIPTEYRGIKYRSRTEARWAVFLDELRVPYAYEPEGFDLGGEWYLPDFWLPNPGCYLEIKGVEPNERERRLAAKLVKAARCPVLIAVGAPPIDERFTLLSFAVDGSAIECAFTQYGSDNVFIGSDGHWTMIPVKGDGDISGQPDIATGPARVAANMRFGVHE